MLSGAYSQCCGAMSSNQVWGVKPPLHFFFQMATAGNNSATEVVSTGQVMWKLIACFMQSFVSPSPHPKWKILDETRGRFQARSGLGLQFGASAVAVFRSPIQLVHSYWNDFDWSNTSVGRLSLSFFPLHLRLQTFDRMDRWMPVSLLNIFSHELFVFPSIFSYLACNLSEDVDTLRKR